MTMAKDDSIVGGPSSPSPRSVLDGSDEWCSDVDDTPLGIGIGLRREREREREREDSVTSSSEEWTSASTEVTSNTAKAPPPPPPPPPIPLSGRQQRPSPEMEDIPALLHTMMTERGVRSAAATKRIYELCDVGHKQNRVPMVCSGLYDVLTPLAWCLTQDSGEPHRRNLACLSLSNLSIPTENKHVMALGPASMAVLGGLCHVLAEDTPESYLCCICLMNLSFLQASIATMLQHSPVPHGCPPLSPLDNPHSLLRILERLLNNANAPPAAVPQSSGVSGKPECVRWACGLIKNLAKSVENAALIGQTDIPRCVFGNVRNASSPPAQWTSNSLEEFSFLATLNLSQWPVSRQALYTIPDRFYSPPECERSPPLAVVYDIRLGAAEGVGESSEATTVNSPATGASEDGDKDPKSIDDTLRCVMEEDSSSIDTYRTGTSTKNSFFGSRRSEKDYSSGDSSGDKSVDDLEGDTRANTFNILPFRFPFNELPRNIMTQSILSYVDSVDWLNFRAVSRGCYQIVHGTLDVWQFSDVTSSAFNADTTANGSECEALWRLALARDYQFDGKAGDECLQSIRSPARREDISWKDDDDIPFLSTRNIFTASNAFISWKHWRKLDSRLHGIGMQFGYSSGFTLGFPRIRGIINAPFYLRAGYMWQKIERWCDDEVSCTYGREIKSSLVPGRPWYTANWACNANLLAYQAVCAFYAGQGDAVSHSPSGLFGGFHACGTTSNTGWVKPHPENPMGYIVIATSQMKDIAIHAPTGQVFSIFFEDGNLHQLVSTTCPGGIVRYTGMGRVEEHPANLADGRDSILVWFEEIADQLRINDQDYTTVLVDVDIHHSTDLIGGNGGGGGENKEEETMTSADAANLHDQKLTHLTLIKYVASISILIFSIVLVGALMFTRNTRVSREANPYVCVLVCVLAITWLSMIEGQQASLVGLPPVDPELYKDSHTITYKNCALAFRGDNFDRYLMGRQFMVLLVVFVINQCGQPLDPTVDVLNMPEVVKFIFLDIGLGMIVFTCVLGQLSTQVIASHSMIDYINNYFALLTLYTAIFIEFTGVMHCAYLIQYAMTAASGKAILSNEKVMSGFTKAFFWGRVLMSLGILGFCMTVVGVALFNGETMLNVKYPSINPPLAVVMFILFVFIVGCLEGMQVAFFTVAKLPMEERGTNWFGKKTSEMLFGGNGRNFPGFMIGRQLLVVACFFMVGAITGLNITPGEGNNIFGISDSAQKFLNFGVHGAVITTIVASITWQYAASAFPIAVMNSPITFVLLCVALCLEATGICHGAWVIAHIIKKTFGYQYDEVYIGTPEERMAGDHPDKDLNPADDVGHLTGGGFTGHRCGSHRALDGPIKAKDDDQV